MKILVTNDDGISAPGIWALAKELRNIAEVVVVAPDREQSAVGTQLTLRQPLRVQKTVPLITGVSSYSVQGTPGDSVILALEKLAKGDVAMVFSGINQGPNLGDDTLISGTVAGALQGYLRDLPSFSFSLAAVDEKYLETAGRLAALLAKRVKAGQLGGELLLNVNVPALPLENIKGIRTAKLAHKMHIDTVREGHDGHNGYYWLVRSKLSRETSHETDIWALEDGYISISALHEAWFGKPSPKIDEEFCRQLFGELRQLS